MKKIIGLGIAALIIMATVGFGSWAYFSDTETSSNNSIVAGTLDLNISTPLDTEHPNNDIAIMTGLSNKAPGDNGVQTATFANVGTIEGKLKIQTSAIAETAGASGKEYEILYPDAQLDDKAEMCFWIDLNTNGAVDNGEPVLLSNNTVSTAQTGFQYDFAKNYASRTWSNVVAGWTTGTKVFSIKWRIDGGTVGNEIQGDGFSFTIIFTLDQNNAP